jgi:hypothetical protein
MVNYHVFEKAATSDFFRYKNQMRCFGWKHGKLKYVIYITTN